MSMIMQRISAVVRHARRGTLLQRLKTEYRQRLKKFRCNHWEYYKRHKSHVDVTIAKDVMMRLYTDDVLSHLIYCKGHEYNERQFLSRYLKTGDVFIDVGANSGLYSLLASSIVGREGRVFAFEPSPVPFTRLKENAQLHGKKNIECFDTALSDREDKMELNISCEGHSAWDTFASGTRSGQTGTREVLSTTLDQFISGKNLLDKITMIKIDVEGWETHVLTGGIKSLIRPEAPLLQIEFTDLVSMPAGYTCRKLYAQVVELGYQLCVYDIKTGQLHLDPPRKEYPNLNLYAVKNLEQANRRLLEKL